MDIKYNVIREFIEQNYETFLDGVKEGRIQTKGDYVSLFRDYLIAKTKDDMYKLDFEADLKAHEKINGLEAGL